MLMMFLFLIFSLSNKWVPMLFGSQHSAKYLLLCSVEESQSYRFGKNMSVFKCLQNLFYFYSFFSGVFALKLEMVLSIPS